MRYWYVGRNDGKTEVKRFLTSREAEQEIERLERIDPKGVHKGEYYIDAPEEVA